MVDTVELSRPEPSQIEILPALAISEISASEAYLVKSEYLSENSPKHSQSSAERDLATSVEIGQSSPEYEKLNSSEQA